MPNAFFFFYQSLVDFLVTPSSSSPPSRPAPACACHSVSPGLGERRGKRGEERRGGEGGHSLESLSYRTAVPYPSGPPLLPKLLEEPQLHLLHHVDHPPRLHRVAEEPELLLHLPLQLTLDPRRQAAAQILLVVGGSAEPRGRWALAGLYKGRLALDGMARGFRRGLVFVDYMK